LQLEYKALSNLIIRGSASLDYQDFVDDQYQKPGFRTDQPNSGFAYRNQFYSRNWNGNLTANYLYDLNENNHFNFLLGTEFQDYHKTWTDQIDVNEASGSLGDDPEQVDPGAPVTAYVDINQLDATLDHVQNLLGAAAAGEDLYIWTWKPFEHGPASPKANGLGATAWKNSNPILVMTDEGNGVYSYTFTMTDFYEVDAATCYKEDMHFLVKPKDGGGYGDPDLKSEDLVLKVDPPATNKDAFFPFPYIQVGQDDALILTYENFREEKESMQNLDPSECYVYAEATLTDNSKVIIDNIFNVGSNPDLMMEYVDEGIFEKAFVPDQFFAVPAGKEIDFMKFIIIKKTYASGADRINKDLDVDVVCP